MRCDSYCRPGPNVYISFEERTIYLEDMLALAEQILRGEGVRMRLALVTSS